MKILVCISNVPDTTAKINFSPDNKNFISSGVTFILNPYDEIALSKALDIATASAGTVTVIHVGDASTEPTIRKALAIGAHDAVRVNADPRDALFVASQIAACVKSDSYDLILCGRESSDHNSSSVPVMLAELLGLPCVLFAKSLTLEGNTAKMDNEIAGGKEVVSCTLPLVVCASEGMAEWKIPNMRGIMSARTKPLRVVDAVEVPVLSLITGYDKPAARSTVKLIPADAAGELFDTLRAEKKII
ncbi:MAG: electron transfer flavoprotein subunit beta/FixA family protein [Bacteroidia bacterium]|nr:electron transfer flavoprotein subunit beta/FixA family protein [Bacteroidia bacterium]